MSSVGAIASPLARSDALVSITTGVPRPVKEPTEENGSVPSCRRRWWRRQRCWRPYQWWRRACPGEGSAARGLEAPTPASATAAADLARPALLVFVDILHEAREKRKIQTERFKPQARGKVTREHGKGPTVWNRNDVWQTNILETLSLSLPPSLTPLHETDALK
jgi:hypothetical protein